MFIYQNISRIFILVSLCALLQKCATSQVRVTDPERYLSDELHLFSKTALKIRTHYALTSKVLGVVKTNTEFKCDKETTANDLIDNISAHWYRCKWQNIQGWVFAGYLSKFRVFEPKKNNVYHSMGNDTANINFELYPNGTFRLHMLNLLSRSGDLIDWRGKWTYSSNDLTLQFLNDQGTARYLFFWRPEDKDKTESGTVKILGPSKYKLDLSEQPITLWGVSCEIVQIYD